MQIDVISRTIVFIVSAITMPLFGDVSFEDPQKLNINTGVRVLSDTFSPGSGKRGVPLLKMPELIPNQSPGLIITI